MSADERRTAVTRCLWPTAGRHGAIEAFTLSPAEAAEGLVVEDLRLVSPRNPADPIPAWLARPEGRDRLPGVICLHGSSHDRDLLMERSYRVESGRARLRGWALELARRGLATVALSQRCYGGRPGSMVEWAKTEQLYGRTAMGGLVEDVLCAVDYLSAHCPWVDPQRIAVTGLSLGGIVAFYSGVVDPRIAAVAPVCGGVGSLEAMVDHGRTDYHSTYYYVPGLLVAGDHAELLEAVAPRFAMIVGAEDDIGMPVDAVRSLAEAGDRVYAAARAPAGAWRVRIRPGGHALLPEDLDAVCDWLCERFEQRPT